MASVGEEQSAQRPRLDQHNSAIDTTLSPGVVKVDVQGAFIVSEDRSSPNKLAEDGARHDTDIRLPNHKGVVSHVALDVRASSARRLPLSLSHRLVVR